MFLNSRSVEDEVDLIVASLAPSQKRPIGGNTKTRGKWEPVPNLIPEQMKLVILKQNL